MTRVAAHYREAVDGCPEAAIHPDARRGQCDDEVVTDSPAIPAATSGHGFPRIALGVGWVLAALSVGVLGWLLFGISDRPDDRVAGVVLLGAFLLGAVTAAAVLRYGYQARWLSLVTSAVFVLGGAAVAVLLSADGTPAASDLLLLGGTPVACGVATGLLALGRVIAARRR